MFNSKMIGTNNVAGGGGSGCYNVSSPTYNSTYAGLAVQEPDELVIKPDGERFFIINGDSILEYRLNTPYSLATGSGYQSSKNLFFGSRTMAFSDDGTSVTVTRINGSISYMRQFTGTAWTVNTFSLSTSYTFTGNIQGDTWANSGSHYFIWNSSTSRVERYDTTSYNILTLALAQTFNSLAAGTVDVQKVKFSPDGFKMFLFGRGDDTLRGYDLSTPWDLTTAVYDGNSFNATFGAMTSPEAFATIVNPSEETKLFFINSLDRIQDYTLNCP